jgi:hypothetical protein
MERREYENCGLLLLLRDQGLGDDRAGNSSAMDRPGLASRVNRLHA